MGDDQMKAQQSKQGNAKIIRNTKCGLENQKPNDSRVLKWRRTCANVINVFSHPANVHLCTFFSFTFVLPFALSLPLLLSRDAPASCGLVASRVDRFPVVCEDECEGWDDAEGSKGVRRLRERPDMVQGWSSRGGQVAQV